MAEPHGLGDLLQQLQEQARTRDASLHALGLATAEYPQLPAVDDFRRLWSQLRAREYARTALAAAPADAGPLNSARLAQRALALMHDASPGYLQHFMTWLDALSWLEQMQAGGMPGIAGGSGGLPSRRAATGGRKRRR